MLDRSSGLQSEGLETVDANCPELERVLRGGGTAMDAYDHREVAGVEVLPAGHSDIADRLKADALAIFNDPAGETPQAVRDVIEWYDASLRVSSSERGAA
jgi:hypothetical protein